MISKSSVLTIASLFIFGFVFVVWNANEHLRAEDPSKKEPAKKSVVISTFMKVKLRQAEGILEGLTSEDFGQIEKNATAMYLLTRAEKWNVNKDPVFIQHSTEFARMANKLAKYAREKNLDGASVTYVQLTLSCIECHQFLRDDALRLTKQPTETDKKD